MSRVEKLRFFDPDCQSDDAIDALLNRLSGDDSKTQTGCRILRNAETGKMAAVFPSVPFYPQGSHEQRKLEAAFEARSLLMHAAQEALPSLEDKPSEIIPKYHEIETRRGD